MEQRTEVLYIVTETVDCILNQDKPDGIFDTKKKFWNNGSFRRDTLILAEVYRDSIKRFVLKAFNIGITIRTGDIISLILPTRSDRTLQGWVKNISFKPDLNWTFGHPEGLKEFIDVVVKYGWLRLANPEEVTAAEYGLI